MYLNTFTQILNKAGNKSYLNQKGLPTMLLKLRLSFKLSTLAVGT